MKIKYLFPLLILLTANVNSQTKENHTVAQTNDTMQYYNENQYKDWEVDPKYLSSNLETRKFLMKGNDRVRIKIGEQRIQVEKTNILTPYHSTYIYSAKTKSLLYKLNEFYDFTIGSYKEYNETGKLIKEENNDSDYKFSIDALIEKMKKEYQADLLNRSKTKYISRSVDNDLHTAVYVVSYNHRPVEYDSNGFENPDMIKDYLIDGNTGKTLLIREWVEIEPPLGEPRYWNSREKVYIGEDSIIFMRKWITDEKFNLPKSYKEYLKKYKRKKLGGNQIGYKTYKGKSYTEAEWKKFEEEQFTTYARKNNIPLDKNKGTGFFLDERDI